MADVLHGQRNDECHLGREQASQEPPVAPYEDYACNTCNKNDGEIDPGVDEEFRPDPHDSSSELANLKHWYLTELGGVPIRMDDDATQLHRTGQQPHASCLPRHILQE